MKRLLQLIAIALTALLLASCARLPMILTNEIGPEIVSKGKSDSLYYSPQGPTAGDTQQEILTEFLFAGNGPQNDYSVAREFLTSKFSAKWQPSAETLIQTGQIQIVSNQGTKVKLRVFYDAKVTFDGTYEATPGASRDLDFRLLQENGEWRISSAPNLTTLLRPNFQVLFQAVPVYFWDRAFAYLVPEIRWFPTKASLATRLTNAMIAGPSAWLEPAVQNILPAGTKLNINSVTVTGGVASIDFNSTALKIPTWKRPYLRSQLQATLNAITGLTQVSISIERTVQDIPTGSLGVPDLNASSPLALTSKGIEHIYGNNLYPIAETEAYVKKQNAFDFAITADESRLALLGDDSVYAYDLGLLGTNSVLVDSRPGLITPAVDAFNNIWTATSTPGGAIHILSISGDSVEIANPVGSRSNIRQILISPEGSRLAILHGSKNRTMVSLFPIIRDKNRKVISLGAEWVMNTFDGKISSVSWTTNSTLTTLSTSEQGVQNVIELMVGGDSTLGRVTVAGRTALASTTGIQYYLDGLQDLYVSKAFGWQRIESKVKSIRLGGQ
jgi:hypothetical protein